MTLTRSSAPGSAPGAVTLAEVADLIPGTTPPREPENYGGGIPLFRPGDLGGAGPLHAARDTVTAAGARHGRLLPPGTVLVSCIGILGKVGILGCTGLTNQQITALVPRPGIVPEYLYYWAQTLRPWLHESASATTLPIVNKRRLAGVRFPLVPLSEQRRIVAKIQAAQLRHERALQALAEVPALLDELQQSVLTSALWPASQDKAMPLVPLGAVADLQVGYAFRSGWFAPTGVRLLRGINVAPGAVNWTRSAYLPESRAAQYAAYALAPGDVVIGLDRPVIAAGLRVARIEAADLPALLVQRVGRLTPRPSGPEAIDRDYLLLCLRSDSLRQHLARCLTGTQLPHLRPAELTSALLPLPPLPEQRRIVRQAAAAWCRIAATAAETRAAKAQLDELWRMLLHRAFHANSTAAPLA